jgi:hypothetical protein
MAGRGRSGWLGLCPHTRARAQVRRAEELPRTLSSHPLQLSFLSSEVSPVGISFH